ncbi:uncharacterized protein LOC122060976 [Macadamia integrifolia]|uniref:uncharacterized protein LOC122060976 n=1 Tax=Macadamia integrifolia TaxID=60698 RepID=UPI001C529095|nr:uncharacterized protein LOC122060976 [Macadamia integrifolia]
MDEIRIAADAYYKARPEKKKKKVEKRFQNIDINRDGRVSKEEYASLYAMKKHKWPKSEHFTELDRDGDGYLDLEDATILHYLAISRRECDVCGLFIKGMFYSCEKCFDRSENGHSYNLCVPYFQSGEFKHKHDTFLDNYVLHENRYKRSKIKEIAETATLETLGTIATTCAIV